MLQKAAEAVNVTIHRNHPLPEAEKQNNLIVAAIYECMTNTVKHADGTEVYLDIQEERTTWKVQLTNDGNPPTQTVKETGGLANLRRVVEAAGGTMTIESVPRFMLQLELPKGESDE